MGNTLVFNLTEIFIPLASILSGNNFKGKISY